jgi:hypothetical protein
VLASGRRRSGREASISPMPASMRYFADHRKSPKLRAFVDFLETRFGSPPIGIVTCPPDRRLPALGP